MRFSASATVLIALTALCLNSCSVSRKASSSEQSSQLRVESEELRVDRDSVAVEVHDTVTVTTTITVDRNDKGDTLRVATVTERDKVRDRTQLKVKSEKLKVVRDTVYVEHRDSVFVSNTKLSNDTDRKSGGFLTTLKWIFAIVCAMIGLIITIKIALRRAS